MKSTRDGVIGGFS